jgi:hypothetical protein
VTYGEALTNTDAARTALLADLPAIAAAAREASSITSAHLRGLRVLLTAAQGNICAGCGRTLTGTVELCHVNPSSNARTGYEIAPGNVYAGDKACNAYDMGKSGADIVASMARPDLVQRSHPDRAACMAASGSDVATVAAIRDAIAAGA